MVGAVTYYRYWLKGKPIPDGWAECGSMAECHHGKYSTIIKKKDDKK